MQETIIVSQSDQELVQSFLEGNQECFSILFDRHVGRLTGYIRTLTNDRELAGDLCQEVFIKVFKNLIAFKGGNFVSWLFTIARRTVIDAYRKRKVHAIPSDEREMDNAVPEIPPVREFGDSQHPLLACLSPIQREILTLRVIEGLGYTEIAQLTGYSEENLRKIFSRTLQSLRQGVNKNGMPSTTGMA